MGESRADFMARWGIRSDQELRDIVTMLQTVMVSQFRRLRPNWSQQFGEEVLEAVESMPTFRPSTSAPPTGHVLTADEKARL
jgi:hypothetical protein